MMDESLHIKKTGVSNKLILNNLRYLAETSNSIHIRIPVIPNINDSRENIKNTSEFIHSLKTVKHISLLPFHKTASHKYSRMNKQFELAKNLSPEAENLDRIKTDLEKSGFSVKIGG